MTPVDPVTKQTLEASAALTCFCASASSHHRTDLGSPQNPRGESSTCAGNANTREFFDSEDGRHGTSFVQRTKSFHELAQAPPNMTRSRVAPSLHCAILASPNLRTDVVAAPPKPACKPVALLCASCMKHAVQTEISKGLRSVECVATADRKQPHHAPLLLSRMSASEMPTRLSERQDTSGNTGSA